MPLPVYMDVHVPAGVSEGLRRKRIDVLTAHEDSARQMSDEELLTRATALGRVLFTQDNDFLEIAARWQRRGLVFGGLVFAPRGMPIGRMIDDAELCLAGMTVEEFRDRLVHLPLR